MAYDRRGVQVLSVSQLNRYVKNKLDEDILLRGVYLKGEISNFVRHRTSGHAYFTLKDKTAAVKCVMFSSYASMLRFEPENGMSVTVGGSVSLFERDGAFQVYVNDMLPEGVGALQLAFEQLKTKLEKQGFFDPLHKKAVPTYPNVIGVIMSEQSAAFRDVCNVVSRRYPLARILLRHASVQGENAEDELCSAVKAIDGKCDVIIIGRGGGSLEDLWSFNSEKLAKVVFEANTPIISAVGHETDFTICDFVADMRAPTPSAAAELATPDRAEILAALDRTQDRMKLVLQRKASLNAEALELRKTRVLKCAESLVQNKAFEAQKSVNAFENAFKKLLLQKENILKERAFKLDSQSPLKKLSGGYARVERDGVTVKTSDELSDGDVLDVQMSDALIKARVLQILKRGERYAEKEADV